MSVAAGAEGPEMAAAAATDGNASAEPIRAAPAGGAVPAEKPEGNPANEAPAGGPGRGLAPEIPAQGAPVAPPRDAAADERFVQAHTTLARPAIVPEIELFLATEITPIWQATEHWLSQQNIEPPFWAFAWPGSQALARLVLDEPARVRGRRVLDFAAGGGLAAIACHQAGARSVETAELDPLACAATRLNARHNDAPVRDILGDVVGQGVREDRWDVILAGDVCYEAPMTGHILPWLRQLAARGLEVWVADPGRAYLPRAGMEAGPRFLVPTTRELEDRDQREVTVWRLLP